MSKKRRERKRITEGVETKDGEYDQSDEIGAEPDDERDENDTLGKVLASRDQDHTTTENFSFDTGTVVNGFQKTAGAGIDQ